MAASRLESTRCPGGTLFEQPRRRGHRFVYCESCRPRKVTRDAPTADGFGEWMRELPDAIARCDEAGLPVIVEHAPPLPEHVQRLYATLGVLVRFVPADKLTD